MPHHERKSFGVNFLTPILDSKNQDHDTHGEMIHFVNSLPKSIIRRIGKNLSNKVRIQKMDFYKASDFDTLLSVYFRDWNEPNSSVS